MSASFSSLSLPSLCAVPCPVACLLSPPLTPPLRGYGCVSVFVARDPHSCIYRVYPSWIHLKLTPSPTSSLKPTLDFPLFWLSVPTDLPQGANPESPRERPLRSCAHVLECLRAGKGAESSRGREAERREGRTDGEGGDQCPSYHGQSCSTRAAKWSRPCYAEPAPREQRSSLSTGARSPAWCGRTFR
jgi:hypothetical protein